MNSDPRYLETKRILEEADCFLPTKLFKVARAGATTGLMANCIDTGVVSLLIAPTKKISHETIQESKMYSGNQDANIQVLLSNHECIYNKIMVKKFPDVGKIPVLPLPVKCTTCNFFDVCPVTALIRSDHNKVDGIGITYQKLQALMFSDSEVANMIKHRLSHCDVIIFDEAHVFEMPDTMNMQVYPIRSMERYQKLFADNKHIAPFLERYAALLHEKKNTIMELVVAHDEAEQHLMSITLKDEDAPIDFKQIIGGIKEVINIMKSRDDYELSVEDVLYIFNMIMMFASEQHVLRYIKTKDGGFVYLSTSDSMLPAIRMFKSMLDPAVDRKIIFTTATFGDFDYTTAFGFHTEAFMPDVMHTNKRITIYPDTFQMDSINYKAKHWDRIVDAAERYVKQYPKIQFVCMTMDVSWWLKNRLLERGLEIRTDYYRSENMIGVSSDDRRCVCVGSPITPINAYDGVSETYGESQKRRIGSEHAAFWQAINRFKSPSGTQDTEIFCIGVTESAVKNMIKWGTGRKLDLNGRKCTGVEVDVAFDEPVVISHDVGRVYDVIVGNPKITRSEIANKLRMPANNVKNYIDTLEGQCKISGEVLDIKRKPIGYTA